MSMKKSLVKLICLPILNKKKRKNLKSKLYFKFGINSYAYQNYFYSIKTKTQELHTTPEKWQTLILGDSHGLHSLCSFLFDEHTFNYAFDNNGLYETYKSLENAIKTCPNINRVILTVSFFNGSTKQIKQTLAWQCRFLHNFIGIEYDFSENSTMNFDTIDYFYNNIKPQNHLCLQGFDFPSTYGKVKNRAEPNLIDRVKKRIHLFETYDNQWIYLEKICHLCKENNIELILVDTPYREDYIKCMSDLGYTSIDAMCRRVYDIANSHGLKYYRITDGFTYDDFHDADHLNFKGAVKYTRQLIDISSKDNQ